MNNILYLSGVELRLLIRIIENSHFDKTATFDKWVFCFMEVWKEIKNYNGIYFVSNKGRVKSVDHFCKVRLGSGKQNGRILKQSTSRKGYLRVSLSINKVRFNTGAHRLVAIAFIPNPENKKQVNHKNGIKDDNKVENLEWCTNKENQIHAVKNGLTNPNYGEKHHRSKLTNDQAIKSRLDFKKGLITQIELAEKFNMSVVAINNMIREKTYINLNK